MFNCNNCDKELCKEGIFTCKCSNLNYNKKCDICESSSYNCEIDYTFMIKCPIKKESEGVNYD